MIMGIIKVISTLITALVIITAIIIMIEMSMVLLRTLENLILIALLMVKKIYNYGSDVRNNNSTIIIKTISSIKQAKRLYSLSGKLDLCVVDNEWECGN